MIFKEDDKFWLWQLPLPGLKKEDIKVTVEEETIKVEFEEGDFNEKGEFSVNYDSKLLEEDVMAYLEYGVLTIQVKKQEKDEGFEVKVE